MIDVILLIVDRYFNVHLTRQYLIEFCVFIAKWPGISSDNGRLDTGGMKNTALCYPFFNKLKGFYTNHGFCNLSHNSL